MKILSNILLAPYTTFRVGGPARFFSEVKTEDELSESLALASGRSLPVFILGGGSNLVVSDSGFPGLVIRIMLSGTHIKDAGDAVVLEAAAGTRWDDIASLAVDSGWWGIENLSGIPGTVGAAPVQNINAYGQSVSDTLLDITVYDRQRNKTAVLTAAECAFGYRKSIFNDSQKGQYVILSVRFHLMKEPHPNVSYERLRRHLPPGVGHPTLQQLREATLSARRKTGMLEECYQSAGSVFKNAAHIPAEEFSRIEKRVLAGRGTKPGICCPDPWHWENGDGFEKVSAACLVHFSGFPPGTREGNVGTSPVHALAIVNYGGASAKEIRGFSKKIQDAVHREFGIALFVEPEFVGEF